MYYTYAYFSESGKPYYVGKGSGDRAYRDGGRNCYTPKDKSKITILKEFESESDAFKHECYMIAVLGKKSDGGLLTNISNGGVGPPARWGSKTPEECEKISKALMGKNNPRWGKPPWNKGQSLTQAQKDRVTGTGNGKSKWWRIEFADGRVITLCGVSNWCRDNGYHKSKLSMVALGKRKRHKDIVGATLVPVEEVAQTP